MKPTWVDAFDDPEAAAAVLEHVEPCTCCGERCMSQLEHIRDKDGPYTLCSACDPALDEHGDDWLCECRRARGDANWELPGAWEERLGLEPREKEEMSWTKQTTVRVRYTADEPFFKDLGGREYRVRMVIDGENNHWSAQVGDHFTQGSAHDHANARVRAAIAASSLIVVTICEQLNGTKDGEFRMPTCVTDTIADDPLFAELMETISQQERARE